MVVQVEYFRVPTFTDPKKELFYQWMVEYFQYPIMQKIPSSSDPSLSIYMCPIQCLLLNEKRYLIVLVPSDTAPIGSTRPLHELRWHSLQTRILTSEFENLEIAPHQYQISRDSKFTLSLHVQERSKDHTTYTAEFDPPLLITLLHTKGIEYEYPNSGTLISALETFQTIVQWKT